MVDRGPKAYPYIMFSSIHMQRSERNMSGNATCCHCQRYMFDRFLERPAEIQFCCNTSRNKTQATFFRSNGQTQIHFDENLRNPIVVDFSDVSIPTSHRFWPTCLSQTYLAATGETYVAIKNPHSWCKARGKSRLMSILISWNIWGTWGPWNDFGVKKPKMVSPIFRISCVN